MNRGARKIEIVNEEERGLLPDPAARLIPPTILLDVPADAAINIDEIFGPVLPVHGYDNLDDAIDLINANPAPLAAYWYGPDNDNFREFCAFTTSGGVTRNDGFAHAGAHGAPFGGVGHSGQGAYHGKFGFDTFTHRRPIVASDSADSVMAALVGPALSSPQFGAGIAGAVEKALVAYRQRVSG